MIRSRYWQKLEPTTPEQEYAELNEWINDYSKRDAWYQIHNEFEFQEKLKRRQWIRKKFMPGIFERKVQIGFPLPVTFNEMFPTLKPQEKDMFSIELSTDNQPTFGQVQENQFFVRVDNYLCQKVGDDEYNVLADCYGEPYATHWDDVDEDLIIKKIIPKIKKFNFPKD